MTAQPMSLFDLERHPLPARSGDPVTARAAAKSVHEAARKAEVLHAMYRIGAPCTASQIHDDMLRHESKMDIGSTRSRLAQLRGEKPRRARTTGGVRVVPKPMGTGRPEQLWDLTDAGRGWLRGEV